MFKLNFFIQFSIFFFLLNTLSFSKEIRTAIGDSLPPYVFKSSNSGIEYDIIKEALAYKGHVLVPVYVPFARTPSFLQTGKADAAATILDAYEESSFFYSDSHISYQNVAITLKERNLKIDTISDLSGKKILAFQKANIYLGSEFAKYCSAPSIYSEIANQETQIGMLYKNRVDVIVMDIYIFYYYKKMTKLFKTEKPIVVHKIFTPTNYKVAFTEKSVRNDFNEGLAALKASGKYDMIFKKYLY